MQNEPNQTEHELYDFAAAAAVLTNEQKILATLVGVLSTLERIEALLTPSKLTMSQFASKEDLETSKQAERAKQINALAAKTMGSRKK